MANRSLARSTVLTPTKYESMLVGNAAFLPGSYELITSQVLSTAAISATFTGIPNTYKHLQVRWTARGNGAGMSRVYLTLNSDSAVANYSMHRLYGDGTSTVSQGFASGFPGAFVSDFNGTDEVGFTVGVTDILDYAATSKNKTLSTFRGLFHSTIQQVGLHSNLWLNVNAVTSVTLTSSILSFVAGSRFSIYGIRG